MNKIIHKYWISHCDIVASGVGHGYYSSIINAMHINKWPISIAAEINIYIYIYNSVYVLIYMYINIYIY